MPSDSEIFQEHHDFHIALNSFQWYSNCRDEVPTDTVREAYNAIPGNVSEERGWTSDHLRVLYTATNRLVFEDALIDYDTLSDMYNRYYLCSQAFRNYKERIRDAPDVAASAVILELDLEAKGIPRADATAMVQSIIDGPLRNITVCPKGMPDDPSVRANWSVFVRQLKDQTMQVYESIRHYARPRTPIFMDKSLSSSGGVTSWHMDICDEPALWIRISPLCVERKMLEETFLHEVCHMYHTMIHMMDMGEDTHLPASFRTVDDPVWTALTLNGFVMDVDAHGNAFRSIMDVVQSRLHLLQSGPKTLLLEHQYKIFFKRMYYCKSCQEYHLRTQLSTGVCPLCESTETIGVNAHPSKNIRGSTRIGPGGTYAVVAELEDISANPLTVQQILERMHANCNISQTFLEYTKSQFDAAEEASSKRRRLA